MRRARPPASSTSCSRSAAPWGSRSWSRCSAPPAAPRPPGSVGQFLATAPPEAQAQFQQTGQLPAPWADQVLAHGISTAFQLAVVFAALALAVALVIIRARTPQEVPVESS